MELGDIKVKTRTFKTSPFARMPATGFSHEDNHSLSSIIWLEHEMRVRNMTISHAGNGGEHRVPNGKSPPGWYKLDGYNFNVETGQETAFEFFGCVFHACLRCFPESSGTDSQLLHPHTRKPLNVMYEQTMSSMRYLRQELKMEVSCGNASSRHYLEKILE